MPTDPRVVVSLLDRSTLAVKAVLEEAWGKQFQEVLNDTGTGKCVLANDDSNLALVEYGDFLQFALDGAAVFTSIIETKKSVLVAEGEEHDEATELSGRGWLAMLEDAVVYREVQVSDTPFTDTRVFNYASIYQPFTGVSAPYSYGTWASAGVYYSGKPTDFPDPTAEWIGPEAPVAGDNPVGYWYFFGTGVVPADALLRLYVAADNAIDFWINDVLVLSTGVTDFETSKTVDVPMTAGTFTYAARIYNAPVGADNPSGFIFSLVELDPDGEVLSIVSNSESSFTVSWVYDYPAEPVQFTPGTILADALFDQAQDRGALPLLAYSFDTVVDSDSVPWPTTSETTLQIGMDYLSVLRQVAEQFSLDYRMDPATPTLHVYASAGSVTSVELEAGVNLTSLTVDGQG